MLSGGDMEGLVGWGGEEYDRGNMARRAGLII